jgi:hypothetical protein
MENLQRATGGFMTLTIVVLLAATVLAINIGCIVAGNDRDTKTRKAAFVSGSLGIISAFGMVLAVLDAFTQIWVKRIGYEGQPVFVMFYGTVAVSICSLCLGLMLAVQGWRSRL